MSDDYKAGWWEDARIPIGLWFPVLAAAITVFTVSELFLIGPVVGGDWVYSIFSVFALVSLWIGFLTFRGRKNMKMPSEGHAGIISDVFLF